MTAEAGARTPESGFTLVETLFAIVMFAVGIMAVSNLMLVAAASNTAANVSTPATAAASQMLDIIKSSSFEDLVQGGSVTADVGATLTPCPNTYPAGTFNCDTVVEGVGPVHVRWQLDGFAPGLDGTWTAFKITVSAVGTGAFAGPRTRAQFTTFRACTNYQPDILPAPTCPVQ
jgi:type II secretory pathway pseudopilin PulG